MTLYQNELGLLAKQPVFIPLKANDKVPMGADWGSGGAPLEDALSVTGNAGVLLGDVSGLLDVDLDCAEAFMLARRILPEPYIRFYRGTQDSAHYLYRCKDAGPRRAFTSSERDTLVELRGNGSQTMFPPSTHPSGDQLQIVQINEEADHFAYDELLRFVALLAVASELLRNWRHGIRHDLSLGFAGLAFKQGVPEETVRVVLEAVCTAAEDNEQASRMNNISTTFQHTSDADIAGYGKIVDCVGEQTARSLSKSLAVFSGHSGGSVLSSRSNTSIDADDWVIADNNERLTEVGVSKALAQWMNGQAVYVADLKQWFLWNHQHWHADKTKGLHLLVAEFLQQAKASASLHDEDLVREVMAFETLAKINNIVQLAAPHRAVLVKEFDTDPYLLVTRSGWVNLRHGTPLEPDPSVLVSKSCGTHYDPDAKCPEFMKFLEGIFQGDRDLIAFAQRAVGYSLTGSIDEQCLFMLIGEGANGKSTFVDVLASLMGSYLTAAATSTVTAGGRQGVGDDIVDLMGHRFISVSETEDGQQLAEAKIKQMTGGDRLKGRPLFGQYIDVELIGKIWLATNNLPNISGQDHGIWRRIMVLPFNRTFQPEEQDKSLKVKLLAELPGILNWAIEGCLEWQRTGLCPPDLVKEQVQLYRSSQDSVALFVEARCKLDIEASSASSDLYESYVSWCKSRGASHVGHTKFNKGIEGIEGVNKKRFASGYRWRGIAVNFSV